MQEEIKQLIAQKDQMQSKLAGLQAQIKALNDAKNYEKGVVDAEGFPRADIDFGELSHYRNLKRQKAEINNDHFALMKEIEKRLTTLHETFPDIDPAQEEVKPKEQPKKQTQIQKMEQEIVQEQKKPHNIDYLTPFAKISLVQHDSPAFKGGLKVNDLISQFSEVNIYTVGGIKQIPKYVKQGQKIDVVVLRPEADDAQGQDVFLLKDGKKYRKITLHIVPTVWAGKGLLGCKIDPLH